MIHMPEQDLNLWPAVILAAVIIVAGWIVAALSKDGEG